MCIRFPAVALFVMLCIMLTVSIHGWQPAWSDAITGVDWYTSNAEYILVVRALDGIQQFRGRRPPIGKWYAQVDEVLKGVVFDQVILVPAASIKPGQRAIVFHQYQHPSHYMPHIQIDPPRMRDTIVWPVAADGTVQTDLPAETHSTFSTSISGNTTLKLIRNYVAQGTPEEPGLCEQVIAACIDESFTSNLAKENSFRAKYVQFYVTIRDLSRDIPELAKLLASKNPRIVSGAADRLNRLSGYKVPRWTISLRKRDPLEMVMEWHNWWKDNAPTLRWDKELWIPCDKRSKLEERWPPLPQSLKPNIRHLPPAIVEAVDKVDPQVFAREFRAWLDSGVLRIHDLHSAQSVPYEIRRRFNLMGWHGGDGPYLPPAPRLLPTAVTGKSEDAETRLRLMMMMAAFWHYERFRSERLRAIDYLKRCDPDSEVLRRAAFWEPRDVNSSTVGRVALRRLVQSDSKDNQKQLATQFLQGLDDDLLRVGEKALRSGHIFFAMDLRQYIMDHDDKTSRWAFRWLVYFWPEPEILLQVIEWGQSPDPKLRNRALDHMQWLDLAHVPEHTLLLLRKEGYLSR